MYYFQVIYGQKQFTDEGREKPERPQKALVSDLQKNHTRLKLVL